MHASDLKDSPWRHHLENRIISKLLTWTLVMEVRIEGNSASGNSRQHNGNVYNNYHNHYNVTQREQDEKDAKRNQSLLEAAAEGQTVRLQHLVKLGADPEYADSDGMTALHHAALSGFEDTVEAVLGYDVNINAHSKTYGTPLSLAAIKCRENVLRRLLSRRAKVEADGGCLGSALHAACASGHVGIAESLIKAGSDVKRTRIVQWSVVSDLKVHGTITDRQFKFASCQPLHIAARYGHSNLVQHLLRSGADLNSRYSWWDGVDHYTSFEDCDPKRRSDRQSALLAASSSSDNDTVFVLVKAGADVRATDKYGGTALSHAAFFDNVSIIPALLDAGADIHHLNIDGASPAALAAQMGNMASLQLLHSRGALLAQVTPAFGRTIVALAAEQGQLDAVQYLIEQKVKLDVPGEDGRTALSQCVRFNHVAVAELLLKHGANIEPKDTEGRTSLAAASLNGALQCVELLLDFHADPNVADKAGSTPLILAVCNNQTVIVGQLLRAGACVTARDSFGRSALYYAVKANNIGMVNQLLRYSGAVDLACNNGYTPLAVAAMHNYHEIVKRLLESNASVWIKDNQGEDVATRAIQGQYGKETLELLEPYKDHMKPATKDTFQAISDPGDPKPWSFWHWVRGS